ncbi:AfsR/SARP family transcriptional regulator [Microbispora sp. ATCC PTA-5024]|uniref:AfsR/SARP family transcriptional regulator n=1 Tax=Microbispora sp. ATCC PTA-5024 TaxID=316330 RepID=UPI0003DBC165|nr:AfsR/SARP family transcriptional regulator [Microbispora sp. ATCC PTA-5024]ETK36543.1 hypothetical protein MPTA5024_08475 [Microbispora sp. ATCC PTA-5024]
MVIPPGPKVRQVLALLLMRPGQVVPVETLVEELWEDAPPRTALQSLHTHVYRLRRLLGADGDPPAPLLTEPTGYVLQVAGEQVDAERFRRLAERGAAEIARGETAEGAAVLREALALWRGRPLGNVACGPVLTRHLAQLEEARIRALELRIEADMRLGRHRELVGELRGLVAASPLNEWFHARLIETLHRVGRRGEALTAFHDLRRVLDRELGLEPSPEVHRLQREILEVGTRPTPGLRSSAAS